MTNPSTGGDRSWETFPTSTAPSSTPAPTSSSTPKDTWGLGGYYNQPVFVGATPQTEYHPTDHSGPDPYVVTGYNDKTAKTQDLMDNLAKMWAADPTGYEALQHQLALAGYYGKSGDYTPGAYDAATQAAAKQAIEKYLDASTSAKLPYTFSEFVGINAAAGLKAQQQKAAQKAGGTVTPSVPLTDPSYLQVAAQQAAQSALGRDLNPEQLAQFVDSFHQKQIEAYDAARAGGTTYARPDPSTAALAFVTDHNKGEVATHNAQGYTDAFLNLFLGGASAAPNSPVNPVASGV